MTQGSKYPDIAAAIRERIEAGEWEPGAPLPTLDTLAGEFGVNRNTVHRAIGALETLGYVNATRGGRAIVRFGAERTRRPRGHYVKRNLFLRGYSFPSASAGEQWMKHGEADKNPTALTDPRIAKLLGVEPGTVVPRRFRVTGPISEAPFQINISWIHPRVADIVADVDKNPAAGEWLYRIEKAGHWPLSWVEFHRARMPSKDEAKLLHIPTSLPVLEIVRQGTSGGDDKPVEVTEYIIASDRVETVMTLERDASAVDPWPDEEDGE
ncbi:GntR family transcriptional regulator [Actinoplanes sp. URMC 104]|uniref:GntR family transcriptional regulator n=1 Tax=Actinoplanes sp. URMC 104 TaxID=3423409 RepID=UPI003F1DFC58